MVSLYYFGEKNKHKTNEILFCLAKTSLYDGISELALDREMSLSPFCSLQQRPFSDSKWERDNHGYDTVHNGSMSGYARGPQEINDPEHCRQEFLFLTVSL